MTGRRSAQRELNSPAPLASGPVACVVGRRLHKVSATPFELRWGAVTLAASSSGQGRGCIHDVSPAHPRKNDTALPRTVCADIAPRRLPACLIVIEARCPASWGAMPRITMAAIAPRQCTKEGSSSPLAGEKACGSIPAPTLNGGDRYVCSR